MRRMTLSLVLLVPFSLAFAGVTGIELEDITDIVVAPEKDEVEVASFGMLSPLELPEVDDPAPDYAFSVEEEVAIIQQVAYEIEQERATEELIERQERLAELGWYEGEADGVAGPLTLTAREDFQEAAGLEATGEVTEEYEEALFASDAPTPPEPEPEPEPEPQPEPEPAPSGDGRYGIGEPWATLAECESGNWQNGGESFERGSARWWWAKPGTDVPPWGTTIHHGGLQFHPGTWDAYRLDGYPTYAYDASPQQQVAVAELVLADQGWGAWPTCSSKMGLR